MTRGAVIGIAMFALGVVMQAIAWGPLHPITWVPLVVAAPFFVWAARS